MRRLILVTLAVVLLPAAAVAQSSITGVVSDNTGGVLPGVTVEAASPVLIEQSRLAITDGAGRYTIVDLRPGTYSVTMTLPGFATVVQEEILLPADFTQTVDGQLRVGGVEETITVTGESPVVDVASARRVDVLTREVFDALPTPRKMGGIGYLAQGVRVTAPDVGGMGGEVKMMARGAGVHHNTFHIDGMQAQSSSCDFCAGWNANPALAAEVVMSTASSPPEVQAGGFALNLIPRDGGNTLSGSFYGGWTGNALGSWLQSDNIDDALRARGVKAGDTVELLEDINPAVGGPIWRDRLWFFGAAQITRKNTAVQGAFFPTLEDWETLNTQQRAGRSHPSEIPEELRGTQGVMEGWGRGGLLRLTAQTNDSNKLSAYFSRGFGSTGRGLKGFTWETVHMEPTTAARHHGWRHQNNHVFQAKWTSTLSSRMLLEVGYSQTYGGILFQNMPQCEITRGACAAQNLRLPPPDDLITCINTPCYHPLSYDQTRPWFNHGVRREDRPRSIRWGGYGWNWWIDPKNVWQPVASISYVTGSHNFKAGMQYMYGRSGMTVDTQGSLSYMFYNDGTPQFAVVHGSPTIANQVAHDPSFYAQDTWTMDRLTLNYGFRIDTLRSRNDTWRADGVQRGRYINARVVPSTWVEPFWKDFAPRFSAVYDLFGDSRTALKVSVNRFTKRYIEGFAGRYHPLGHIDAWDWRQWNDCALNPIIHEPGQSWGSCAAWAPGSLEAAGLSEAYMETDGDGIVQDHEIGLNRATALFNDTGEVPSRGIRPDPDIEREWNIEYSVSVQHELADRVSVTGAWYRREFYDVPGQRNLALNECAEPQLARPGVQCGDWIPFNATFTDPQGRLPQYTGTEKTLFVLDPNRISVAQDLVQNSSNAMDQIYSAFELSFNARLNNGGTLFGGWTAQQWVQNTCGFLDSPNGSSLQTMMSGERSAIMGGEYCDQGSWGLPFRHDFKLYGVYPLPWDLRVSGGIQAYSGDERLILWTVGPNLHPPGFGNSTQVVLNPPGTEYTEYWSQLDLSLQRIFNVGGVRYQAQLDIFNALNDNSPLLENNVYGSQLFNPTSIIVGRLIKFGVQVHW